jgi:phytanoyl-CoA dioxygenase PhyH
MSTSSPAPVEALAVDGFASLGPVLDGGALASLRGAVDGHLAGLSPAPHGIIVHNLWRRLPAVAAVLETGQLGRIAAALLGAEEVVLFQDHLIAKTAGAASPVAWHQDYAYWPLDRPAGVTIWIALDDAAEENGCLRYVPGTHRAGERRAAAFVAGAAQPARDLPVLEAEAEAEMAAGRVVAVPVAAGAAVAHDPLVWHMSPGNRTAAPRRAWSLSWILPAVRWAPGHAPHPYNLSVAAAGAPVEGAIFPRFGPRFGGFGFSGGPARP